jgi:hypothetical protein
MKKEFHMRKQQYGKEVDGSVSVCHAKPGNEGRYGCHHVEHVMMDKREAEAYTERNIEKTMHSSSMGKSSLSKKQKHMKTSLPTGFQEEQQAGGIHFDEKNMKFFIEPGTYHTLHGHSMSEADYDVLSEASEDSFAYDLRDNPKYHQSEDGNTPSAIFMSSDPGSGIVMSIPGDPNGADDHDNVTYLVNDKTFKSLYPNGTESKTESVTTTIGSGVSLSLDADKNTDGKAVFPGFTVS